MLFREIRVSLDDGLEAKEEQNKWGDIRSHAGYARIRCVVELHQGLDSSAKVPTHGLVSICPVPLPQTRDKPRAGQPASLRTAHPLIAITIISQAMRRPTIPIVTV